LLCAYEQLDDDGSSHPSLQSSNQTRKLGVTWSIITPQLKNLKQENMKLTGVPGSWQKKIDQKLYDIFV
jgi:hypothetical protein